jgi:hypothetical protein
MIHSTPFGLKGGYWVTPFHKACLTAAGRGGGEGFLKVLEEDLIKKGKK